MVLSSQSTFGAERVVLMTFQMKKIDVAGLKRAYEGK